MDRRSLLKYLASAPALAAIGVGTTLGKKVKPAIRAYSIPRFHDWDCKPGHLYGHAPGCTPGCRQRNYDLVEEVQKIRDSVYTFPNGSEIHYKPVSAEEERRIFAAFDQVLDNIEWDEIR